VFRPTPPSRAPVTPTSIPVGTFPTDTALDIDDGEDVVFFEEDAPKDKLSGPLFIFILLVILILQIFFVGWLVSNGVIPIDGIFGN
jgi:hypothetical protein